MRLRLSRLLCLLLCLPLGGGAVWAADAPIVVVLSWDGMRHDYPDRGKFPGLSRIEREGVRAGRLTPVFPSSTFPGHVSMATGTYPDRHGIVDNTFFDPERGRYAYEGDANWLEAEPLWIAAERQGVKTATYFWVGSESDWRGSGTSYRVAPFDGSRPEAAKVDQMLEWLSLPEGRRPRLIMSYWAGADSVGHDRGPDSDAVISQIQNQDRQLRRLLTGLDGLGLWPRTTLILVSDHGMAATDRVIDLRSALAEAGIGARLFGSTVVQLHLEDQSDGEGLAALLDRLLGGLDGAGWYARADLPPELRLSHPRRTGDWTVWVPPPYTLSRPRGWQGQLTSALGLLGWTFGSHGYDPQLPDMGGIFMAMGRGIQAGSRLGEVHQVDLAATVSALLAIEPPAQSEGKPVL